MNTVMNLSSSIKGKDILDQLSGYKVHRDSSYADLVIYKYADILCNINIQTYYVKDQTCGILP
jgi:hypothetical protein